MALAKLKTLKKSLTVMLIDLMTKVKHVCLWPLQVILNII